MIQVALFSPALGFMHGLCSHIIADSTLRHLWGVGYPTAAAHLTCTSTLVAGSTHKPTTPDLHIVMLYMRWPCWALALALSWTSNCMQRACVMGGLLDLGGAPQSLWPAHTAPMCALRGYVLMRSSMLPEHACQQNTWLAHAHIYSLCNVRSCGHQRTLWP